MEELIPALEEYPYIDDDGIAHDDLVRHYREDGGAIIQAETGAIYDGRGAIDVYPCRYHYYETEIPDESLEENIDPQEDAVL